MRTRVCEEWDERDDRDGMTNHFAGQGAINPMEEAIVAFILLPSIGQSSLRVSKNIALGHRFLGSLCFL